MNIDSKDIEAMNDGIAAWTAKNKADILKEMDALDIKHSPNSPNKIPLRRALQTALSKQAGLINKISFKMPRSAIFLHKGVSRGHGKDNPRKAKEWYNPPTDKNIDALADIVAEAGGNIIINNIDIH